MSLSLRVCIRFHRTKYEIKARYVLCKMLKLRAKTDSCTQRYGRQPSLSNMCAFEESASVCITTHTIPTLAEFDSLCKSSSSVANSSGNPLLDSSATKKKHSSDGRTLFFCCRWVSATKQRHASDGRTFSSVADEYDTFDYQSTDFVSSMIVNYLRAFGASYILGLITGRDAM